MKKILLMKQPAGLGDILFTYKIAKLHVDLDYKVIWPVVPVYVCLNDYLDGPVEFVDINSSFLFKEEYQRQNLCSIVDNEKYKIIAIDGCGNGTEIMKSKYDLCHIPWEDWANSLKLSRNLEKEKQLLQYLNPEGDPYYVVAKYMGTPPNHLNEIYIPVESDLKRIEIDFIDGYNLFDWAAVMESAEEIHIEGSAMTYICEVLDLKASKMYLFSRDQHRHFHGLFKKPWTFRYDSLK